MTGVVLPLAHRVARGVTLLLLLLMAGVLGGLAVTVAPRVLAEARSVVEQIRSAPR
ncbi:hypothetical protein [Micromonospora sp. NBC_01796]|uniref:hypothetical protein n=1 Tax=Micromonospora sp. NBC_01796 TaxID=2975987 RepID=UPI002DDBC646|nr:hypothetical protein [Micromonospora sp. NBC_01796]WSA87925.1 hypothetical protein OIE47_10140 [Micromonospora sp. NBC_01796]